MVIRGDRAQGDGTPFQDVSYIGRGRNRRVRLSITTVPHADGSKTRTTLNTDAGDIVVTKIHPGGAITELSRTRIKP